MLDAKVIGNSQHLVEELRRMMEITPGWEELILPASNDLPLQSLTKIPSYSCAVFGAPE